MIIGRSCCLSTLSDVGYSSMEGWFLSVPKSRCKPFSIFIDSLAPPNFYVSFCLVLIESSVNLTVVSSGL